MRKLFAAVFSAVLLSVTAAAPVSAHDGWSQTNAAIISPGQVSYIDLMFGNHSNEHKSYRLEGQWSKDNTKVYVTTPSGKKSDITSSMFYAGEPATEKTPAINNFFATSFSASTPGAYIISAESDSIFKNGDIASRTLRSAKSFTAIADIPNVQRVKYLQGFGKQVSNDRAEIVPLFNPAAITSNKKVQVKLLLKGEPLADTEISVIRRSNSDAQIVKTDASGSATFTTGASDYYLLRAEAATKEMEEGKYNSLNFETTMTFLVQNESPAIAGKPNPLPSVYVNNQLIDAKGLKLVKGTAFIDASVLKEYVDAGYQGQGQVALKSAAQSLGAEVEYLASVGDIQSAIHIYIKK